MPSYPRVDKGEGFIRSHDLLSELNSDVGLAYETLEQNRNSQYLRRCVVRAIFSYIEALIEIIKIELRSNIRTEFCKVELTEKEEETLGSLFVIGSKKADKQLPLDDNIKRTFQLAAKIWELNDYRLSTNGEDFVDFTRAKSARNRLTHPRTFYDIQVTDEDMSYHTIACHWVRGEFERLFQARVQSIANQLPPKERERLLNDLVTRRANDPTSDVLSGGA